MKIKIIDESFFYGEKVTVCKLKCEVDYGDTGLGTLPYKLYQKYFQHFSQNKNHEISRSYHTFYVEGRTKCCKADKYDELTGKRLAEAKAFKKAYKIAAQISSLFLFFIEREREIWLDNFSKYDDLIVEESCNIAELSY